MRRPTGAGAAPGGQARQPRRAFRGGGEDPPAGVGDEQQRLLVGPGASRELLEPMQVEGGEGHPVEVVAAGEQRNTEDDRRPAGDPAELVVADGERLLCLHPLKPSSIGEVERLPDRDGRAAKVSGGVDDTEAGEAGIEHEELSQLLRAARPPRAPDRREAGDRRQDLAAGVDEILVPEGGEGGQLSRLLSHPLPGVAALVEAVVDGEHDQGEDTGEHQRQNDGPQAQPRHGLRQTSTPAPDAASIRPGVLERTEPEPTFFRLPSPRAHMTVGLGGPRSGV